MFGPLPAPPRPAERRLSLRRGLAMALVVVIGSGAFLVPDWTRVQVGAPVQAQSTGAVRIVGGAPSTYDPALQGDSSTANVLSQLFEGLTAFDPDLQARPALADTWSLDSTGLRLTFHLRAGIVYSDGTPIAAQDVVDSWMRLIDPSRPGALASILDDVAGARAYREGRGPASAVGLAASGDTVTVTFARPASYFLAIAASPSLAIVPPSMTRRLNTATAPTSFVGSGAYTVAAQDDTSITLKANARYWAGRPSVGTVTILTNLQGKHPVDVFLDGDVDYVGLPEYSTGQTDAEWIRYDRALGPQLREVPSLSTDYYGFDTTRPPFDDARVRRAFAEAIDWHRLVSLVAPDAQVATSLVPPGIPGRSSTDFVPAYDPDAARRDLASAGFAGGRGFPEVTLVTPGMGYDEAMVKELHDVLGITVALENMPSDQYFTRLATNPPQFWGLTWVADYPAPQDFLGLLLGSGSSSNYGHWSNADYDAAIEKAASYNGGVEATQAELYDRAQAIVKDQVPVIPVAYPLGWALSRNGLLGASPAGVGTIRLAGLAWAT